jgi:hypothetical protein
MRQTFRRLFRATGDLIKRMLDFLDERSFPKKAEPDPDPYKDDDNLGAC